MLATVYKSIPHVKITPLKIANSAFKSIHSQCDRNYPLEGVRVLDLTRIVAGPYCTMILGDLGAEVIKIERPGSGDEARKWGPPFINTTTETAYFVCLNRNKKSVCVDLKSQKGRDILYKLAEKSDVLVENYVPGKLDEMGLGYEHFKGIAPHLIYCSISGFGPDGPYRNKPGYDVIAASMGGFLHITGPQGGEPCKAGVAMTDLSTGLYAHGAIMAGLFQRTKTGKGQKIDCNLLSTQIASLINIGSNYLNTGKEASRWGTAHESIVPYEAFPTKDGYYTIGTGSDLQFQDLCGKLKRPDLAENEKFKTNQLRVKHRIELINTLRSIIVTKTKKEWSEIFEGGSFPSGPVNSLKETFDDPHVKEIGLVQNLEHPVAGTVRVVGPPVKYSDGGNSVRSPPPTLGQHTKDVLETILKYSTKQINDLKKENIIQ
ncbi:succinate--hydroxymethylglutarate CoA-transferase [Tribolium madens]|uniref:succinate--hydroxymethylglutarate CoA-transferase n=1 Tax=Tribolium madens TaxID=41895 RepID=UPI001CF72DDE|nr:succinate--hydroxymethylglutarate CoA-transferase [Tribolium madens]